MTNAQHTPGPWVYHAKTSTVQPYPGSGTICALSLRGEREANARLIAAAPELLAALEKVDAYLAPEGDEDDAWHDIRVVIQEAIARAKGE